MILSKLQLDEAAELEFSCEVYGTADKPADVRFVIENKEFDIICKCLVEKDTIKVNVPKLKGILESGEYKTRLEVVLADRIFTPMCESVEFEPLVEFSVERLKTAPVKEGVKVEAVGVKVVGEATKQKSTLENNLRKVMEEGYDVAKVGSSFIVKKDDGYIGVVGEEKVLMSDKAFSTVTELLDSLS